LLIEILRKETDKMSSITTLEDLRNFYGAIVLANETTIVEVLTAVIDSFSPRDTDSLSKTEDKEEKRVEKCDFSTGFLHNCSAASSINVSDACNSMMSGVDALNPILLEIVRRLKEQIKQREDQLEYGLLPSFDRTYLPPGVRPDIPLSRLSNQARQECDRQFSDQFLNRQQSAESQ
jgi:hypothetical protein